MLEVGESMELVVPHTQFCSYKHFHRECYDAGSAHYLVRVYNMACKPHLFVLPDDIRVIGFRKPKGTWSRKHLGSCVFAVSKYENSGMKSNPHHSGRFSKGPLTGVESSANGINASQNFMEFEIHRLRRLIRNGELEEGSNFLEYITDKGNMPDVIACTALIREFCKIGRTKNATRVMDILEKSGAVIDVTSYNVLISGYCKSGETEEALWVLDRMSVAPNAATYDTILCSLCERGKLKQAMEVFHRQLQSKCFPDVVTCTVLIDATCKENGVGQAMKLFNELRRKGCKPDVVTYNVLIKGICKEVCVVVEDGWML